jgi:hypothetical protein
MIFSYLRIHERITAVEMSGGKLSEAAFRSSNSDSRRATAERTVVGTAALVNLRFFCRGRVVMVSPSPRFLQSVAVETVACGAGKRGRRADVAVEIVVCGAGRRGRRIGVVAPDVVAAAVENVACGAGRRGGRIDVVAADVVVVAVETVA